MFTSWKNPRTVTQYAEVSEHIAWDSTDNMGAIKSFDARSLKTVSDLLYISNPTVNNIRNKTWYIVATDFAFTEQINQVTGIQVQLQCNRNGRITDETVQLYWNGSAISENLASEDLDMIKIYGTSANDWGIEQFESDKVLSPEFGLLMRFQSHPFWPHRSSMYINSVAIRLSYLN
jgi:hypothetical protein